jgi:DNA polymerase III subunit alpha
VKYVSLHHHSTYSYMDGFASPAAHAERVAELGMSALALTEHGNVSSHPALEKAAVEAGIRPIFGLEAYTALDETSRRKFHLTILASNEVGYRNLMHLTTASWKNFYQWPTVTGAMLAEYNEGLIVLSGCADSLLACSLLGGKTIDPSEASYARARRQAEKFRDLLGDRFYLETQMFPELERSRNINSAYERLGSETGIPLVATADCHYPRPDDNEMQVILHAAGRGAGSVAAQEAGWEYDIRLAPPSDDATVTRRLMGTGLSRRSASMALANTAEIAVRCDVVLPKAERLRFPVAEIRPGLTARDLIWEWLRDGWKYRVAQGNQNLRHRREECHARLKYEMELIQGKDFVDYFLMLADVLRPIKDEGIPVGPARGSAAASLVCYLLRITEVDPMDYPLMFFERFIAPDRQDTPDIDLDFDDELRWRAKELVAARYGADRVGNLATYTKYRGKNSIMDVARVFGIPKADEEALKSMIIERSGGDSRADQALGDTIDMFPAAKAIMAKHPDLRKAIRLEGNYRGMGVNAAGLIIAGRPIADLTAMYTKEKADGSSQSVVSVDKKGAEYIGLLKADFLGLSTLGMIRRALEIAGVTLEELYRVPMTDAETLDAFRRNDVVGVFQFEGRATRLVNREVQPDNFLELADINGLSRPGPLFSGTTAEYIAVKRGEKEPTRFHPIIDAVTAETKGQIIYQEQVLLALKDIGGLPLTRVGEIRRIISQKLGEAQFNESMGEFCENAEANHGLSRATAEALWGRLVTSATYSFNIAHCVSYSMLAFWCMWLKVHYPHAFYTAQLTKSDEKAWPRLIRDAERHGLPVRGVKPGASGRDWTAVRNVAADARSRPEFGASESWEIRAGWLQVPGIGPSKAEAIEDYLGSGGTVSTADDLLAVKGIGPAMVAKLRHSIDSDDPFGLQRVERGLAEVRTAIADGSLALPAPTVRSDDILDVPGGQTVTWLGYVKLKEFKDYIEDERARSGRPVEEIRRGMKRPDLPTSCVLHCYDDGDEDVYVRVTRFDYRKFTKHIASIDLNRDVVWVRARKSNGGFGASIYVENLVVLSPD